MAVQVGDLQTVSHSQRRIHGLLALLINPSHSSLPPDPPASNSPLGKYSRAAVAADQGLCSEIGRDILIRDGNAVDAAVAVDICVGVMSPQSSGLGGGLFMTIYNRTTGLCHVIDAREAAPLAASTNMYEQEPNTSTTGWHAIGVPGNIHGLWTAFSLHGSGRLSWADLLQPTIQLLQTGVPVSPALAKNMRDPEAHPFIVELNSTLSNFIDPNTGQVYKEGDILKHPMLLRTLQQLANATDPVQFFYNSSFTADIVKEIRDGEGIITLEDMSSYSSLVRNQSETLYTDLPGNLRVCGPPPPSSAAVAMSLLKILAGLDVSKKRQSTLKGRIDMYQDVIESMKFAYADRSRLGDLDFVHDALWIARNMTSEKYVQWVLSKLRPTAQPFAYYDADFAQPREDHGTEHMSVLDAEGNAVSWTCTINLYFGSKRRSVSKGIVWNNEMDDFSSPNQTNAFGFPPSKQNFIKPGKRPQSSMCPIVVFNTTSGQTRLVVGAAGGSRIISTTAYVAWRALYLGDNIKQAMDAPRLHNQLAPMFTRFEHNFDKAYVQGLRARGQNMSLFGYWSHSTAIHTPPHDLPFVYANSDYREGSNSYTAGF